jgi:hypothetical protein
MTRVHPAHSIGTTGAVPPPNPVRILPERSDVYDVDIVQQLLPTPLMAASVPNGW